MATNGITNGMSTNGMTTNGMSTNGITIGMARNGMTNGTILGSYGLEIEACLCLCNLSLPRFLELVLECVVGYLDGIFVCDGFAMGFLKMIFAMGKSMEIFLWDFCLWYFSMGFFYGRFLKINGITWLDAEWMMSDWMMVQLDWMMGQLDWMMGQLDWYGDWMMGMANGWNGLRRRNQMIETAFNAKLSLVQVGGKLLGFPGRKTQQHRAIRFPEGEPNW
ncbi:hypothetical protein DERP_011168 [Dermatophagoides pteronyssinus]|uniref:Uncharacterized protein n=1 Tax=Dermatophagoides pteronyssinus TaxID=6956 RepID=A0ABQ8J9K9_DERPT|nr:hypothetical protein DERP_011168 [Dermatophagoides pteronyssinus]